MRLSDFDYELPVELIAQEPAQQRDHSRLLVLDRNRDKIEHRRFFEIVDYLREGDLLVFNDTRVLPARLEGRKHTGGRVEVLLTGRINDGLWTGIVKPGRRVQVGAHLLFADGLCAEVVERTDDGGRVLRFDGVNDTESELARQGKVPLPPYIHKELNDPERYQTVYSLVEGSAAAPTAGLHFTDKLLEKIKNKGVRTTKVTLHVGIATFRPVRTENIEDHQMHSEWFSIAEGCIRELENCRGRIIAVGTTTVRALESAAVGKRLLKPVQDETRLFITPGYEFRVVDCLITNFHVPKSTLLMMVSALAGGADKVQKAYEEAKRENYRFLSFGDAMFVC